MRICFVIGSLDRGGAELQLVALASGLQSEGHRVDIVALRPDGDLTAHVRSIGLEVHGFSGYFRSILGMRRLVRRLYPDIMYAFMPAASVGLIVSTIGMRDIPKVWGVRAANLDRGVYGLGARAVWWASRGLSRFPDLIIANSTRGLRFHVDNGYPEEKMIVISNGVDLGRFNIDHEERSSFRRQHGFDDSDEVVGMLARFDPNKGQVAFVEAMAEVRAKRPRTKVVLAGGGDRSLVDLVRHQLSLTHPSDDFRILEPTSHPSEFLNGLDLLVIPSQSEGFPNVALEAMACGVPVVGYDVGDLATIIRLPGRISRQSTPYSLAVAICETLDDMNEGGYQSDLREHIEANYSMDVMVRKTEEALLDLVRSRKV